MAQITISQAAELTGKSTHSIYNWIRENRLEATRLQDGTQVVDRDAVLGLNAYINDRKKPTHDETKITIKEAAVKYGKTTQTIRNWIKAHDIRKEQDINGAWLLDAEELDIVASTMENGERSVNTGGKPFESEVRLVTNSITMTSTQPVQSFKRNNGHQDIVLAEWHEQHLTITELLNILCEFLEHDNSPRNKQILEDARAWVMSDIKSEIHNN